MQAVRRGIAQYMAPSQPHLQALLVLLLPLQLLLLPLLQRLLPLRLRQRRQHLLLLVGSNSNH